MKRITTATALIISIAVAAAEEPSPPKQPLTPQEMSAAMKTAMGSMATAAIHAQLDVLSQPDSADRMAHYLKNLYDALLKQGFTKAEALEIVTRVPLPGASTSR
jgi:hypothetical protein